MSSKLLIALLAVIVVAAGAGAYIAFGNGHSDDSNGNDDSGPEATIPRIPEPMTHRNLVPTIQEPTRPTYPVRVRSNSCSRWNRATR